MFESSIPGESTYSVSMLASFYREHVITSAARCVQRCLMKIVERYGTFWRIVNRDQMLIDELVSTRG